MRNLQYLASFLILIPLACGWGYDGHITVCRIAQARLRKAAAEAVKKLLPASEKDDLGRLCPWPDTVKYRYRWSSDLHFINTPDHLCSYKYNRDCRGRNGAPDRCLVGAINNYTNQLLSHKNKNPHYNLTEALLFLSHFIGDIHQPLHVGFASDKGGNNIRVTWYKRKQVLHHIWDTDLIKKEESVFNHSDVLNDFVQKIQQETKTKWANQINGWEACIGNQKTCPNIYAAESVKAACQWAYKGVHSGSIQDEYFSRTDC